MCDADRVDNFYKLQQLTFLSYAMNGDAIVLLPTKEQTGQPYSLRVRLVEADRVCSPDGFDRLAPARCRAMMCIALCRAWKRTPTAWW